MHRPALRARALAGVHPTEPCSSTHQAGQLRLGTAKQDEELLGGAHLIQVAVQPRRRRAALHGVAGQLQRAARLLLQAALQGTAGIAEQYCTLAGSCREASQACAPWHSLQGMVWWCRWRDKACMGALGPAHRSTGFGCVRTRQRGAGGRCRCARAGCTTSQADVVHDAHNPAARAAAPYRLKGRKPKMQAVHASGQGWRRPAWLECMAFRGQDCVLQSAHPSWQGQGGRVLDPSCGARVEDQHLHPAPSAGAAPDAAAARAQGRRSRCHACQAWRVRARQLPWMATCSWRSHLAGWPAAPSQQQLQLLQLDGMQGGSSRLPSGPTGLHAAQAGKLAACQTVLTWAMSADSQAPAGWVLSGRGEGIRAAPCPEM